jgi:hypothetical protein
MEVLADLGRSYFEFFSGDFVVFGLIGSAVFIYKSKKEDDFYG